ncbi:MAG: hypothetical protein M9894_31360 [Planctomycetes bacterium]|nr:hypothetical protein [Planctomycetota bacterium]
MSDVFDPEGSKKNQGAAAKKPGDAPQKPPTGEGERGRHMQYDNEWGAMMIDIPPRFAKYKAELEEDLMDAFYGDTAGAKQTHQTINEWVADWMKKKEQEDPSLIVPDEDDPG